MRFSILALSSIITVALTTTIPLSAREQLCTCKTKGTHCGSNTLGLQGKCHLGSIYTCEGGNGALPTIFQTCSYGCVESQVSNGDDTCRVSARDLGPCICLSDDHRCGNHDMMGNCDMNILYDCRGSKNDAPKGSHHCADDCTWGGGGIFADHCTLL